MIQILRKDATSVYGRGPFRIRRIRPGLIAGQPIADPVVGPLSVIDHATLDVGTVVGMHEHRNDEIFSYLWRGVMIHEDSTGQRVELTPRRLMMMNAGKSFFHEESTPTIPVEMLQIFIRPETADLTPQVQFYERPASFADGQWQLLAGPTGSNALLLIRNQVLVYDADPQAGVELTIPTVAGFQQWVYIMDGAVTFGDTMLTKGDAISDPIAALPTLQVKSAATVVAFLTNPAAPASLAGSHSEYRG